MTTYTGHWMAVDAKGNNQDGGDLVVEIAEPNMGVAMQMALQIIGMKVGFDPIGLSVVLTREDG